MRLWNSLDKRIPAFSDFFLQIIAALLSTLVRCKALADVRDNGAGKRYLIQHSAGSGKSNSIAWLSHQLIGVKRSAKEVFDSVIVVTDRRILDDQIRKTIKRFMQVSATVGFAEHSGDLRKFIECPES
jgi:type I restriction enzyme, R subunit